MKQKGLILIVFMLVLGLTTGNAEETEKRYSYKRTSLTVEVEDRSVSGVLYMPKNIGQDVPVVVFCHGFTGTYTTFLYACDKLARRGIACYAFDFYGGSISSISGGSMTEMSVYTEQEDLDAVVDAMKAMDGIDTDRICILGHSQGGYVCTLEAARHPDKIHAVFLYAPALHIAESMTDTFPDRDNIPEKTVIGTGSIGRRYVEDVWGKDIYEDMPLYSGPVAIVHGDKDDAVALSYSERALDCFPNATLTVLPGVDHNLVDTTADVLIEAVLEQLQ